MERNIWARRICELREANGQTQQQVADGVSAILGKEVKRETINQWECDTRQLKAEAIKALSQHFRCSADYLLGLSDAPTNDKDLQFICDSTGLSPDAAYFLQEQKDNNFQRFFIDFMFTKGQVQISQASADLFGAINCRVMETFQEKENVNGCSITKSDGNTTQAVFYDLKDAFDFYSFRAKDAFGKLVEAYLTPPEKMGSDTDAE